MKLTEIIKLSWKISFLILLFSCKEGDNNLSSQMKKLSVDTVLIVNSNAIDNYPIWSKDSKFIAVNISGQWYKFDLSKDIKLLETKWLKKKT